MLYDSIISEAGLGVNRDAAPLMERVDGVAVAADALGHTFGVRVQWTRQRREGSEGSKGSKGSEGGGGGFAASFIKKERGWRRGLCRRVMFAPLKGQQRLCR